jgi:hypothetical protein
MDIAKKKFKIVVGDKVVVPVSGHYMNGNGRAVQFKFDLVCKRMDAEEMREAMGSKRLINDILKEVVTDWRNQRLVLNEDDSPADFDADAFDALLNISGLALVCFNAYAINNGATEKN